MVSTTRDSALPQYGQRITSPFENALLGSFQLGDNVQWDY